MLQGSVLTGPRTSSGPRSRVLEALRAQVLLSSVGEPVLPYRRHPRPNGSAVTSGLLWFLCFRRLWAAQVTQVWEGRGGRSSLAGVCPQHPTFNHHHGATMGAP